MADTKSKARKTTETSGSIEATVFVPSGPTPRNTILQTAITAVRDSIPVIYTLNPEIVSASDVKTVDGVKGRDYKVAVNYEAAPNVNAEDLEPVNVDAEIEKLTVPALPDYQAAVAAGGSGSAEEATK